MKIIHTSDWHLGQRLYNYDRTDEEEHFFDQLGAAVGKEQPDALLVSGDVFHTGTPGNDVAKRFTERLLDVQAKCPEMEMVVIAGNHDSYSRLVVDEALWRRCRVHVLGTPAEDERGRFFGAFRRGRRAAQRRRAALYQGRKGKALDSSNARYDRLRRGEPGGELFAADRAGAPARLSAVPLCDRRRDDNLYPHMFLYAAKTHQTRAAGRGAGVRGAGAADSHVGENWDLSGCARQRYEFLSEFAIYPFGMRYAFASSPKARYAKKRDMSLRDEKKEFISYRT